MAPSSSSASPKDQLLSNILFGGIAGVVGTSSVFPLYTIKTNLHLYPSQYANLFQAARSIVSTSGLRGLYKGLPPALVGVFPEKAIKLSVNDYLTAILSRPDGSISLANAMLAGASAGFSQVIATNPMELTMINMQSAAARGEPISMPSLVRKLGVSGLYKGTASTLLRDVPFSLVFFSMNTKLREYLTDPNGHLPMSRVFTAGIASGSVAAVLSTPADVIKTRLQASAGMSKATDIDSSKSKGLSDAIPSESKPRPVHTRQFTSRAAASVTGADKEVYAGIADCARKIYAKQGLSGFFAGVGPRVLIISPLFGITLWFYDIQRRMQESGKL